MSKESLPLPNPIVPTPPSELNWGEVENKFQILKEFHSKFQGKPKHNPYLYWKHRIEPTRQEYIKAKSLGLLTKELHQKIMALPVEAPTLDKFPDQGLFTTLTTSPEAMKVIQQTQQPIDPSKLLDN